MEGRIQKLCLAGTRTKARAASRTHFYFYSGISTWIQKDANTFFQEQRDHRPEFPINPFNSRVDHVRSLRAKGRRRGL